MTSKIALPGADAPVRRGASRSGLIVWFTGLSGAGKSTLAARLRDGLSSASVGVEVLDGDEVRTHLSKDLGFSKDDRDTNIRRIGFVARLLARHGVVVITAAISPYASVRAEIRGLAEREGIPFIEVFVDASLDCLIARDAKGLYRRALAGEVEHFTGVSDPYEAPTQPEITVHTDRESVAESSEKILAALVVRGLVSELSHT
jgi:adenylyl-sulfate kinase